MSASERHILMSQPETHKCCLCDEPIDIRRSVFFFEHVAVQNKGGRVVRYTKEQHFAYSHRECFKAACHKGMLPRADVSSPGDE